MGDGIAEMPEQELFAAARRLLPGGMIGRAGLPEAVAFLPTHGAGARVFDSAGRGYVDYLAGAGALILGHAHPAVTQAICAQAGASTAFFGLLNRPALELAEIVVAAAPRGEKLIYATTGSEATMYAMRLARAFTGKPRILKFEGAYHGNHDFVQVSVSTVCEGNDARGRLESLGVPREILDETLVAPFNDLDAVDRIVGRHRGDLAAIMLDAFPRAGVFPEPGFVAGLREIADRHGVLLIFDEVLTGFRLAWGGAQEYFGVEADLVSYGKIIGGGLPIGAVVGPVEILSLADAHRDAGQGMVIAHGTHHGAPVAAAAGLAALREIRANHSYARLNALAQHLRDGVADLLQRHGTGAIVTGRASYWHVAFRDRPARNQAEALQDDYRKIKAFDSELVRNGVYLLPGGRRLLTFAHDEAEIEATLTAVEAACRAI